MNRLFGTKKKEEPKIAPAPAPKEEDKKIDLVEQAKKVGFAIISGRKQSQRDRC